MPTKTKKTQKHVVTRKFILDLADSIYNPQTRRFLRLCNGTLQNGPDPTDKKRPMHCGLGELYFAMTGNQPEDSDVDERGVVDEAVALSVFSVNNAEKAVTDAVAAIRLLSIPDEVKEDMIYDLETRFRDADEDEEDGTTEFTPKAEAAFRQALAEIPSKNDDVDDVCTYDNFRSRSARVARQLREAAKHLPK